MTSRDELLRQVADLENADFYLLAEDLKTAKAHAEQLKAEIKRLKEDLQTVERWANHHGAKPNMTAQEALSCIQHYPPIRAITLSYADGKVPETPNPWAEVERLRVTLEIVLHAFAEIHHASTRPDWFTRGQEGATQHRLDWERRCIATIKTALGEKP
jgi:cell fate (sporulation/competence/biofilm development) regulator YlbF (YheA/YmcA/DUF963 family)